MLPQNSPVTNIMCRILELQDADLPILLKGETGTGKSYLARAIHESFGKTHDLFLTLDCATLNPNLIESELFGYEKGAFTGANEPKSGVFDLARHSTVLLDEVENLTLDMQAKLLRVLDEKRFRRVGGTEEITCHFQLISTVNVDLENLLQNGSLRRDFYHRIAAVEFTLPPLRERLGDIIAFAEYFLQLINKKCGRNLILAKAAKNYLRAYPWPGNVRELKQALLVISRSAKQSKLEVKDFEPVLSKSLVKVSTQPPLGSLIEMEEQHIRFVLERTGYKIGKTSQILGIAENTLRAKMKKYGIKRRVA